MKEFLRKIWDAIVRFIEKVPYDKLLHFCFGLIIAAVFGLAIKNPVVNQICIIPVILCALAKEAFDMWTTGKWDWWDVGATCIGGALIELFVLI